MSPTSPASVEAATARIGERLSALRSARGMRVSELARRASVSSSLISQIERGQSRPSVATLFAVATVLEVPVDAFFAEVDDAAPEAEPANGAGEVPSDVAPPAPAAGASADDGVPAAQLDRHVVRRGHRASIDISGGVRWERLTATALAGVEFLELVYAPGAESHPQAYRHPGIEMVLVLEGTMSIFLGFEQHDLGRGDSIAFPSTTPHRYANLTDGESRAVTVILQDDLSSLSVRTPYAVPQDDAEPASA